MSLQAAIADLVIGLESSVTVVASSASSVQIKAANDRARGVLIYNDSTAVLYLRFGTADASTASFTVQMASETYYEVPALYRGAIQGIWAAANGNAMVTELS